MTRVTRTLLITLGLAVLLSGLAVYDYVRYIKPAPVESIGELELLAVTPGGSKIYRVNSPRAIVPTVIVEGKDGHVAVR